LKARRNVNAVNERQPVRRFAHGARRYHPHLCRVFDLIFLENAAVALQHARAILNRRLANRPADKRVFAKVHRLSQRFELPHLAPSRNLGHRHPHRRSADIDHRHLPCRRGGRCGANRRFEGAGGHERLPCSLFDSRHSFDI
jgi:hypothetical protein